MATYLTSKASIILNQGTTEMTKAIPLKSVDLVNRKIPLIHRVQFEFIIAGLPLGLVTAQCAVTSSDSISAIRLSDDEVISNHRLNFVNGESEGSPGSGQISQPTAQAFLAPIAVAKDIIWLVGSGCTGLTLTVGVAITYEVKAVSASVLVALMV